jgi:hypothetical protein
MKLFDEFGKILDKCKIDIKAEWQKVGVSGVSKFFVLC